SNSFHRVYYDTISELTDLPQHLMKCLTSIIECQSAYIKYHKQEATTSMETSPPLFQGRTGRTPMENCRFNHFFVRKRHTVQPYGKPANKKVEITSRLSCDMSNYLN
ncbi:hypothetical protein HK096_006218, partial [Nowakowskiella sp. JEL0078]